MPTIGAYWLQHQHWSGTSFGAIFSTMGIASVVRPSLAGIIADKWINAERLYGVSQIAGAIVLFCVPLFKYRHVRGTLEAAVHA